MESLDFYSTQSPMSDPGEFAHLFKDLPTTIPELCGVVHGAIIHRDATEFYGFKIPDERTAEIETRYMDQILKKIIELDGNPLSKTRLPEKRFTGSCRDFALLLTSILRYQNTPARLRCGFAGYFNDMWDDHWITEYWDEDKKGWVLVDPEIDDVEYKEYNLTIDPDDIPKDKFLNGGEAWIACRNGKQDSNKFGVSTIDLQGLWFVRANVVRDLASLNKVEMLPWDYWGIADKKFEEFTEEDYKLIDQIALVTATADDLEKLGTAYKNSRASVPHTVHSFATFAGESMVQLR